MIPESIPESIPELSTVMHGIPKRTGKMDAPHLSWPSGRYLVVLPRCAKNTSLTHRSVSGGSIQLAFRDEDRDERRGQPTASTRVRTAGFTSSVNHFKFVKSAARNP